jgi:hypothetical protein
MNKFSDKNFMEMTEQEMYFAGYAAELSLKYIEEQIKRVRGAKFENDKDVIYFHPCVKDSDPYQVTYFWKKDGKPSGDIICGNIEEAAEEIYNMIGQRAKYLTALEVIE